MRTLDEGTIRRFVPNSDLSEADVVCAREAGLSDCALVDLPPDLFARTSVVDFSQNRIQASDLPSLWKSFPNCWWLDLSHNFLQSLPAVFPCCMGSLVLNDNPLPVSALFQLEVVNILRLCAPIASVDEEKAVVNGLPLVWVFNDQFISHRDRALAAAEDHSSKRDSPETISWRPVRASTNEGAILSFVHRLGTRDNNADNLRADVLLEDYIAHAGLFSRFVAFASTSPSVCKAKPMMIPPVDLLFSLSHRDRLDLSVLLTASILFPIPSARFRDAVLILLKGGISRSQAEELALLPPYVRTALVSLLRRISRKELNDQRAFGLVRRKPKLAPDGSVGPGTYEHHQDYLHLRTVKAFLEDCSEVNSVNAAEEKAVPFSDLEQEILSRLPDCPTAWMVSWQPKLSSWMAFAARHAVFLLSKSPSCPPLTRPARSLAEEEGYYQLVPLLAAAQMTLSDLEIFPSGGREIKDVARVAHMDKSKQSALKILGPQFLPFSSGLPHASTGSLRWTNGTVTRNYIKPWLADRQPKEAETQLEANVFVTDGLLGRPPSSPGREQTYRLDLSLQPESFSAGTVHADNSWTIYPLDTLEPPVTRSPSPIRRSPRSPSSPSRAPPSLESVGVENFPPEFRPHSRSHSDLQMRYPPPRSRPHSPLSAAPLPAQPRSFPAEPVEDDGDTIAQRSFVSISLPSVQDDPIAPADDFFLTPGDTPRCAPSRPKPAPAPSTVQALPALLSGQLRSSLLPPTVEPSPEPASPIPAAVAVPRTRTGVRSDVLPSSPGGPCPIQGYAADVLWEPNFLLAPSSAVQAFNSTIRDTGVTADCADLQDYWRELDRPPVVLLDEAVSPFAARILQAKQSLEVEQEGDGHRLAVDLDVVSIDDSVSLSEHVPAYAKSGRRTMAEEGERSPLPPKKLVVRKLARQKKRAVPEDSQLTMSLLRSLGTVRNVQQLDAFNQAVQSVRLGSVRRCDPASLLSRPILPSLETSSPVAQEAVFLTATAGAEADAMGTTADYVLAQEATPPSPSKLLPRPKACTSPTAAEMARASSRYDLIYTMHDWEEEAARRTTGVAVAPTFRPVSTKATFAVEVTHNNAPPPLGAQQLRQTRSLRPRDGSAERQRTANQVLLDGRRLAASWQQAQPQQQMSSFAPLSFTAFPGTTAEDEPAGERREGFVGGEAATSADAAVTTRNLQLVRSHPFLKKLLLRRSSATTPRCCSPASGAVSVEEDVISTVSSGTLEHAGLIYEVYSSQVLSSVDQLPSLPAMDHSLTHSLRSRHSSLADPISGRESLEEAPVSPPGKTPTTARTEVRPLSDKPSSRQAQAQAHLQPKPQLQQQQKSSSVFRDNLVTPTTTMPRSHRAATHKLALNRSFRMKLPSLKPSSSTDLMVVSSSAH